MFFVFVPFKERNWKKNPKTKIYIGKSKTTFKKIYLEKKNKIK